jgi:hypothetical protein
MLEWIVHGATIYLLQLKIHFRKLEEIYVEQSDRRAEEVRNLGTGARLHKQVTVSQWVNKEVMFEVPPAQS